MADKIERDELVKMLAALPNSDSCMATYGPPANYQNIPVFRGGSRCVGAVWYEAAAGG